MLISRTDLLAIVAVVDIAIHGQMRPVKNSDIGPRHGLSERYFEPILQVLSGSGILTAVRGRFGGYQLARAPSLITAGEVVRAIRTTEDIAAGKIKSLIAKRIVLPVLKDAQLAFAKALQDITSKTSFVARSVSRRQHRHRSCRAGNKAESFSRFYLTTGRGG